MVVVIERQERFGATKKRGFESNSDSKEKTDKSVCWVFGFCRIFHRYIWWDFIHVMMTWWLCRCRVIKKGCRWMMRVVIRGCGSSGWSRGCIRSMTKRRDRRRIWSTITHFIQLGVCGCLGIRCFTRSCDDTVDRKGMMMMSCKVWVDLELSCCKKMMHPWMMMSCSRGCRLMMMKCSHGCITQSWRI